MQFTNPVAPRPQPPHLPTDNIRHSNLWNPAVLQKLHTNGVHTYAQLIEYTGDIPGIDLGRWKNLATSELENLIHVSHNWEGRVVHVVRAKGRVTRGVIEKLTIGPHRVYLNVRWSRRGKIFRKTVTPVALLCAHILWSSKDIVSEDSEDDSCDPVKTSLPKFLISTESTVVQNLPQTKLCALNFTVKETNQLFNCVRDV